MYLYSTLANITGNMHADKYNSSEHENKWAPTQSLFMHILYTLPFCVEPVIVKSLALGQYGGNMGPVWGSREGQYEDSMGGFTTTRGMLFLIVSLPSWD